MTKVITGELYKKMIINAATAIERNKKEINDLNVFPVPDGDTGTNMSLTISAAENALSTMSSDSLSYVADAVASALLRGARGNSGVILSLLFRGFTRSMKDVEEADAKQFANALVAGVESAYKAVMKPAEGTILTVSRLTAGAAVTIAAKEKDIEKVLEKALEKGYLALEDTINQNPVLKKAGVIDAGGKGYLYILDGMLKAMRGEMLEKVASTEESGKADFTQFSSEDITFGYCTEFIIERTNKNNVNKLRKFLDVRGDSIVVVDDDEIIKVHVHTNDPGVVLTEALCYGSLLSIKIDNMREQHSEVAGETNAHSSKPHAAPEEMKDFGFVAVCAGKGIEAIFNDLGVDRIILGGQTMNPSTEDILEKIIATPSNTVFVLPNNKNIILAAQQCIPLTEKVVIVIPTKSIPQGVSALLSIDGITNIDEMTTTMTDIITQMSTVLITTAARNSVFDDTKIKKGEHLALLNDVLCANGSNFETVLGIVAEAIGDGTPEFITIYTGEDAKEAEVEVVSRILKEKNSGAEIMVIEGGQPVYNYIISAE
ncbi:MAG: DAK2 domain-containing protein [Oscillospiraceae bacterium]|nr:DAK2 domain-containing protein [Oscillospiraceae bacterium]